MISENTHFRGCAQTLKCDSEGGRPGNGRFVKEIPYKKDTSKQLAKSLESGFQGARPGTGNEGSTNNLFMKVIISKWLAKVLKSD